jgi:hypothetical protein
VCRLPRQKRPGVEKGAMRVKREDSLAVAVRGGRGQSVEIRSRI